MYRTFSRATRFLIQITKLFWSEQIGIFQSWDFKCFTSQIYLIRVVLHTYLGISFCRKNQIRMSCFENDWFATFVKIVVKGKLKTRSTKIFELIDNLIPDKSKSLCSTVATFKSTLYEMRTFRYYAWVKSKVTFTKGQ